MVNASVNNHPYWNEGNPDWKISSQWDFSVASWEIKEEKHRHRITSFSDKIKEYVQEIFIPISFVPEIENGLFIIQKKEIFMKEIECIEEEFEALKDNLLSFATKLLNGIKENQVQAYKILVRQEIRLQEEQEYDIGLLNDIKEYEESNTIAETLFFDIVNIVKKIWQIKRKKNDIFDDFIIQLWWILEEFNKGTNILENLLSYFKDSKNSEKFTQNMENPHGKLIWISYTNLKKIYLEEYEGQKELVQNPNFTSQLIAIRGTIELILLQLEQGIFWSEVDKETIWDLEKLKKICHRPSLSERLRKILEELKGKEHSIREEKFLKIMQLLQGKWKDWLFTQSMLESNKKIFTEIKKNWKFEMGEGSFFIPWWANALRKIIEYWIVSPENIDIKLWKWDNIQEGLQLRKEWDEESMCPFDKEDTLEKLKLHIWNGSSLAHVVTFFTKENQENKYTIEINIWDNSFVGIGVKVGTGLRMWNNSTIWFQSYIGENVSIGNNVLIGTGCTIDDWVEIKDNYLVPNFAHITKASPLVSY